MDINYSIIIPHKNIPVLLQRCLDSIPSREDIEIIVVDDNSAFNEVGFNHFPGTDREDVKVIFTKEGKGAGYARNCGLEYAKGKWLLFADADDFFHSNLLQAIDRYVDSNYDIVFFDSDSVDSDTLEALPPRIAPIVGQDEGRLRYGRREPTVKLISRLMVEKYHIRYEEVPASNDVMFSAITGYYAKAITVSPEVIYCITVRKDSLWYGMKYEHLLVRIEVACRYSRFLRYKKIPSKYRIYAYDFVCRSRVYGFKAYLKAFFLYLRQEHVCYIYEDFSNLLRAKLHKK
jgi:glycosyltransferase involved in cell wall biosynthesis